MRQPIRPTSIKRALWVATTIAALAASAGALAQDRADIDRTQILGNRELPKVLYIVPWKKPMPGELNGKPVSGVLDEALAPIDRDVFRRQLHFDSLTRSRSGVAATQAAATATKP